MTLHEHEVDGAAGLSRQVGLLEVGYRDLKADLARIEADRKADIARFEQTMLTGLDKIGAQIAGNRDKTEAEIRSLRENMAAREKANWPVVMGLCAGGFGIVATLVGGAYFLTSQQTAVLVQPLALRAEVLGQAMGNVDRRIVELSSTQREIDKALQTNESVDARSQQDRADLNDRVQRLTASVAQNTTDMRGVTESLKEIESQFAGDEQVAKTRESYQQRWNGIFYEKIFNSTMPALGPTAEGLSKR